MTSLLLNTFLVLLTLAFGAMAYYPLFLKGTDVDEPVEAYGDDVVISVVPATREVYRPTPISAPRPSDPDPEHPGHRPAA